MVKDETKQIMINDHFVGIVGLDDIITGMNPKASFGNRFRSKLRGIKPTALRDCSTYQFRSAYSDL